MSKIAWCTGRYAPEFRKRKAQELREKGYKVSFGSYIKEDGVSYGRIYLEQDLNYYVIQFLNSVHTSMVYRKKNVKSAIEEHKESLKDTCKRFNTPVKVRLLENKLVATIDNNYELIKEIN